MSRQEDREWKKMLAANPELRTAWETFDRLTAEALAMMDAGQMLDDATGKALANAAHAVMNAANRGRAANDWT